MSTPDWLRQYWVRRSREIALASVVVGLLLILSVWTSVVGSSGPLHVQATFTRDGATNLSVTLRITSAVGSLVSHVALVPGGDNARPSSVFVFYDPLYPVRLANPTDVVGLEVRLSDYLAEVKSGIPVSFVDAAQLPNTLAANPRGALVIFGYALIPDDIFSGSVSLLKSWIDAGGTLIWAGGPLGYFEGHSTSSGFVFDDLGWSGQSDLIGYSLEDEIGVPSIDSSGPLTSVNESKLGSSLGITYPGTADGANVSEVISHGGTDMGFDSVSAHFESPRTSLAYVPVGDGQLYYFGGALWGTGSGVVPNADTELSGDMALIIQSGYTPSPGTSSQENLTVQYHEVAFAKLSITTSDGSGVAIVTSTMNGPSYVFFWTEEGS